MFGITRRTLAAGAALLALGWTAGGNAQQPVKIGAIYPLSGNSASAGNSPRWRWSLAPT
jgi:branched-chain amino acid transport system substrate-binding protein